MSANDNNHRGLLPAGLAEVEGHLRDSVWSLYDPPGVEALKRALASGAVR